MNQPVKITLDTYFMSRNNALIEGGIVALTSLGFLVLIRLTDIDLKLSNWIYSGSGFKNGTFYSVSAFLGKYLSLALTFYFVFDFIKNYICKHQVKRDSLLVILLFFFSLGIVSYLIFKPAMDRPRPEQISNFNKSSSISYVKVFETGKTEGHSSFPSGHAGSAFILMFPWFIIKYRKRYGSIALIPGLFWGLFIGTIRISQGKHFLSDVVGSFLIVYMTGLLLMFLFYRKPGNALEK